MHFRKHLRCQKQQGPHAPAQLRLPRRRHPRYPHGNRAGSRRFRPGASASSRRPLLRRRGLHLFHKPQSHQRRRNRRQQNPHSRSGLRSPQRSFRCLRRRLRLAPPDLGSQIKIILTISFCHLLNDTLQSLIPAIYPLLKNSFHLDFGQVGLIALTLQLTASILQPLVGLYTDRRPQPYSLAVGMGVSLAGLLALALAPSYATVLAAAALMGIGSAVFHPESSRVARMASGGQHGMAQSLFQVGGNAGSALGPLLAAFVLTK